VTPSAVRTSVDTRVREVRGDALLDVDDLRVDFGRGANPVHAVRGVSFTVARGEMVGIVGESGSGKSVTALAMMGLLDGRLTSVSGSVRFAGQELIGLGERAVRRIRGRDIAMVFQEPMTALDPVFTVGHQLTETIHAHEKVSRRAATARAVELFASMGIPDPAQRLTAYPHQLSGGLRQRAMIAMALSCGPQLLIADEPTTAVDVTVQAQILDLLRSLREQRGTAIVLITHDIAVVAESCDRMLTMYAGQIVETGCVDDVLGDALHPYSRGLLGSIPSFSTRGRRLATIPGRVPLGSAAITGCLFAPRCPFVLERCRSEDQELRSTVQGRAVRCWRAEELMGSRHGRDFP
jgi:peptide/nickel transport system ATP-binding protein